MEQRNNKNTPGEIVLSGVTKYYGIGESKKAVIEDCSLTIEAGKLSVMIGPSGCGKSSLIRLIAGFEKPSSGTITIDGKPIRGPGKDRLVVFQESALFPWMTTEENISFGPIARSEVNTESQNLAKFLIDKVGLSQFKKKFPNQLSGGMQRRCELARALINSPEVMILDEPFRGLDEMTKELMWEYYANLYEETRQTNFFVTTDIDEAVFLADRLIIMTNTPTKVAQIIEVDIPRPRKLSTLFESDQANEIKSRILKILHVEAMKSFKGGSKAAADFIEAASKRAVSNTV
jgi:NitT/TauT family transport system ATP-binding protein